MLKKVLTAVAAVSGGLACSAAIAAAPYKCEPTQIHVGKDSTVAHYMVKCSVADVATIAPNVEFAGEVNLHGTAPYKVEATYRVDAASPAARALSLEVFKNQIHIGQLLASTTSTAVLPDHFASKLKWDAASSTMSIEEVDGTWRAFQMDYTDPQTIALSNAGVASLPVVNGKSIHGLTFDSTVSRFAAKGHAAPKLLVQLGLKDGKLVALVGETRAEAQLAIKNALQKLDQRPKDATRAWALASIAQFMGLEDEVRYATEKVAAHNPQLVSEFNQDVNRIKPFVLDVAFK